MNANNKSYKITTYGQFRRLHGKVSMIFSSTSNLILACMGVLLQPLLRNCKKHPMRTCKNLGVYLLLGLFFLTASGQSQLHTARDLEVIRAALPQDQPYMLFSKRVRLLSDSVNKERSNSHALNHISSPVS